MFDEDKQPIPCTLWEEKVMFQCYFFEDQNREKIIIFFINKKQALNFEVEKGAVLLIKGKINIYTNKRSVSVASYTVNPVLTEAKPFLKFYESEFPSDFKKISAYSTDSEASVEAPPVDAPSTSAASSAEGLEGSALKIGDLSGEKEGLRVESDSEDDGQITKKTKLA